jgi:hypothetical protein
MLPGLQRSIDFRKGKEKNQELVNRGTTIYYYKPIGPQRKKLAGNHGNVPLPSTIAVAGQLILEGQL